MVLSKIVVLMIYLLVGLVGVAHSEQVERPVKRYGSYKEVSLTTGQGASVFEMKAGKEKEKLLARCESALGGSLFDLYVFNNAGKKIVVIRDGTNSGQNVESLDYYVVNQRCEPLGKKAGLSYVASEPKGSYHMASIFIGANDEASYLLTEERYGPGKRCMFINECERIKGYVYDRSLFKITERGLAPVFGLQKRSEKDVDIDKLIPISLN